MFRANVNTGLIVLNLIILVMVTTSLDYHLEVKRSEVNDRFTKSDSYDENVNKRIDLIQDLQHIQKNNLERFNGVVNQYENKLSALKQDNNQLSQKIVHLEKLSIEMSTTDRNNSSKIQKQIEHIAKLKLDIDKLNENQNKFAVEFEESLDEIEYSIDSNSKQVKKYLGKYGTYKMRKNLQSIENSSPTLQITKL